MPFEVKYDEDMDCIFVAFTGRITMKVVREYLAELLPVLESSGCRRLLSDSLGAELHLSALDIVQFPKLAAASPLTLRLKRAVLVSPGTSGDEMYETMSNMQGQNVRAFKERDEAMAWLMEEPDRDVK